MVETCHSLSSSSLRRRFFTAGILAPIVVAAVLGLPTPGFALFVMAVILLAAWEWCGLAGMINSGIRIVFLILISFGIGIFWIFSDWQVILLFINGFWWLLQIIYLLRVRKIDQITEPQPVLLIIGLIILIGLWAALIHIHQRVGIGPSLVLFLMLLIWAADSLAYFVGRRWGRVKLAPSISPGKTRIGVYGAIVGAVICGWFFAWIQALSLIVTFKIIIVCILSALISVVGDLYESLLKRRRELKDSSQLLPGHGGLLDRIDSLIAAAPIFALGLIWALPS